MTDVEAVAGRGCREGGEALDKPRHSVSVTDTVWCASWSYAIPDPECRVANLFRCCGPLASYLIVRELRFSTRPSQHILSREA